VRYCRAYWRGAVDCGAAGAASATKISTRRFLARPSGVLFSAIGSREPRPSIAMRLTPTPRATRESRVLAARFTESGLLIAPVPVLSVWPMMRAACGLAARAPC
jgi:hypothetical protein